MRRSKIFALAGVLIFCAIWAQVQISTNSNPALASFDLQDQFEVTHKISFPTTNVTLFTVADRKGSEQIDGWMAKIKASYARKIAIEGVADVSGVPGPLRSWIRDKFKKKHTYPIMLDWEGHEVGVFHYKKDVVNLYVVDREGHITGHFTGEANEASIKALFASLDLALAKPSQ